MRIGVPAEIKEDEDRVGLTPNSVHELVAHGHEVVVEAGAGHGIGADDDAYRAVGATIAPDAPPVFDQAELIVGQLSTDNRTAAQAMDLIRAEWQRMHTAGVTDAELLQDYPSLNARDLAAAWTYVDTHPEEIENAIQANRDA